MPSYDTTRFSPPAPVGLIEVRNPATGAAHANVPMLIDTGAEDSFNDTAMLIPGGGDVRGVDGVGEGGDGVRNSKLEHPSSKPGCRLRRPPLCYYLEGHLLLLMPFNIAKGLD